MASCIVCSSKCDLDECVKGKRTFSLCMECRKRGGGFCDRCNRVTNLRCRIEHRKFCTNCLRKYCDIYGEKTRHLINLFIKHDTLKPEKMNYNVKSPIRGITGIIRYIRNKHKNPINGETLNYDIWKAKATSLRKSITSASNKYKSVKNAHQKIIKKNRTLTRRSVVVN